MDHIKINGFPFFKISSGSLIAIIKTMSYYEDVAISFQLKRVPAPMIKPREFIDTWELFVQYKLKES